MAQIIVTAATPMVEDGTDKSFPPVGESEGGSAAAATAKTASSDDDKPVKQKKVEPKPVVQAAADENENHEGKSGPMNCI